MSTNINMETENGRQLSRDFLKENLQTLWVNGIIVLDTEGKIDCEYSTDESLANEITEYLQKEIIRNGLTGKTDHILTLQPVPEKMHRVSLLFIIIHLRNLPGTIL